MLRRATQTLAVGLHLELWLLDIALEDLALGRAYGWRAIGRRRRRTWGRRWMACAGREGRTCCPGPAGPGAFRREQGDLDAAARDLDEALEIATRGGMRLHQADCYLEFARLTWPPVNASRRRRPW